MPYYNMAVKSSAAGTFRKSFGEWWLEPLCGCCEDAILAWFAGAAGCFRWPSAQPVAAVSEELDQPEVAKELQLLADFGLYVAIGGVKARQVGFQCVGLCKIEVVFPQGANSV